MGRWKLRAIVEPRPIGSASWPGPVPAPALSSWPALVGAKMWAR